MGTGTQVRGKAAAFGAAGVLIGLGLGLTFGSLRAKRNA
jgi:hypothetical protein